MVAENDIASAMKHIEQALCRFVGNGPNPRVRVLETEHGHVHALVGSDEFKGRSVGERQKKVWDFLQENVSSEYLGRLYGVQALDVEEFDGIMREAQLRLFIHGTDGGETADE